MKWYEIKIKTTEEASDAINEMLASIGANGVAIEDPNDIRREISRPDTVDYADEEFISSLGEDVVIKAYFPGNTNIVELEADIREKISFISGFLHTGEGFAGYTEVDDEDWSNSWKKYYKPLHISDRVVIKPSWEQYEKSGDEIVVELDPGMAFGTGTHETTRMCAQLLESYLSFADKVLDVGCGTGILAIIAAKLGAGHVTAIDIDEVAVRVTEENSKINMVQDKITACRSVLGDLLPEKHDIAVANIIADVIIDISKIVPQYLKHDGYFITSGIIKQRKQEVLEACGNSGFKYVAEKDMGEWVAVVFKCQNSL
ncbi:MAG: 50S ribosomal protein L11 methyltransferase [Clostridia bacterium]|nr:50S ribosomal protein L11 methyltransferase [Clostridia bacterium]